LMDNEQREIPTGYCLFAKTQRENRLLSPDLSI